MRGCRITLFEKSGKIGGNFGTIASVGFKHRIRDLIWWYNNQLNKLGVDLRLNTEITADDPILSSAPTRSSSPPARAAGAAHSGCGSAERS